MKYLSFEYEVSILSVQLLENAKDALLIIQLVILVLVFTLGLLVKRASGTSLSVHLGHIALRQVKQLCGVWISRQSVTVKCCSAVD